MRHVVLNGSPRLYGLEAVPLEAVQKFVAIEDELDELFSVLRGAEEAGFPVHVSYVT